MAAQPTEQLLASGRKRSVPGKCFKAKVDGRWQDYATQCNKLILDAYAAGCPSVRLNVQGHMYKFDFQKMQQKNLNTLEICDMRAPHDAQCPAKRSLLDISNFRYPRSMGCKALRDKVCPQRPVFVMRVPEGGPGKTIRVPHPKKLGKALAVAVPAEAEVGQPLFVPVPRTEISTKVKYAIGGGAVGTTGAAAGMAIGHATGTAVAGGVATVGGLAALGIGGVAVVGAVVAAGVGVHYATRNPGKAVAIGALTIGGLALASHIADVGIVEAAGDVAEGAGDLVEGVGDVATDALDAGEDLGEAFLEAGDWLEDAAEDGVDIVMSLF